MRIGVNTRLLVEGKMDGIGWFTWESLRRMVEEHPEHQFFLFFDRQPSSFFKFANNATIVVLCPQARHPVLWDIYFNIVTPLALHYYKIDLYISTDGYLPLWTWGKIPTLNIIHDINFEHSNDNVRPLHQRYFKRNFPRYARLATRLATVSEFSRQDIASTYNIPTKKIGIVYNGSNANYKPLTTEEQALVRNEYTSGQRYFIFVSTIYKRKNLQGLLRAYEQMRNRCSEQIHLVVVGARKWWGEELAAAYNALTHSSDVHFMGHTSPEELARLLGSATALVYPSFFEGFGIPILEAFYAETAVITSNVTSMPEVAGSAALFINPSDHQTITDAMLRLATDETLRQQLITLGREQRTLFSWQRTAHLLWNESLNTISPCNAKQ